MVLIALRAAGAEDLAHGREPFGSQPAPSSRSDSRLGTGANRWTAQGNRLRTSRTVGRAWEPPQPTAFLNIFNHQVYFHIGNPAQNEPSTKTAVATLMINVPIASRLVFELPPTCQIEGGASPTGRLIGGMQGSIDGAGNPIDGQTFDIYLALTREGGTAQPPDGADPDANLVWFDFPVGAHVADLTIRIAPPVYQAWGNYSFSPQMRLVPVAGP